jgi:hypothetical protein
MALGPITAFTTAMDHSQGANRHEAIQFPPWRDEYSTDDTPRRFIEAFVNARELEAWGFRRVVAAAHGHPSSHLGALLTHSIDGDLVR